MAAAMRRGLDKGHEERSERWRSMMAVLTRNTVATWSSGFLAALAATPRPAGYSPRRGGAESGSAQSAEGGPDGLLIKF
jgi:trehalose-6-phosphate synthase